MFVKAVKKISEFTHPIHIISRNYNGETIFPGTATLFFINEDGCAITCKHVAEMLIASEHLEKKYKSFKEKKSNFSNQKKYKVQLKELEKEYNYNKNKIFQLKSIFMNCIDAMTGFEVKIHPTCDLAIIEFKGFKKKIYKSHAVFLKDGNKIKQGKSLCRFGFPFPEFNNFKYNEQVDDIEWTEEGRKNTPSFPIDGIITRHLVGLDNKIVGIEMSTPGLRGQSGGPLFDDQGIIYGMQSATGHLHLGFDLENKEVISDNKIKKVTNQPFLNVGQCIHVDIIKEFLKNNNIKFYEE